ncbi:MAG: hypothetical protein HY721_18870 [Planctomycetes bacterium]|nr:hypothetical protein [Planctomycetota bacterium]
MTLAPGEPKYSIDAPDFRCQACSKEIPCETAYLSAVSYEAEGFRRRSYCVACWKPDDPGVFAFWRARRPPLPADKPKRARLDTVLLLDFFRRLGAEAGPEGPAPEEREELSFVISLLLVRKKVLRFENAYPREGVEWLKLVEKPPPEASGPPREHWVKNPEMSDAQLERVKVRIGELLQMQL